MRSGVTVLLASFDGADFIDDQLDSIAAQSVLPYELIVTDDGSRDGTVERVEAFAARAPFPVRLLRRPAPVGYSANFLTALGEVRSELVAFCDQDDVWAVDKVKCCAAAFVDEEVSLCAHRSVCVEVDLVPVAGRRHTGIFARMVEHDVLRVDLGSHLVARTDVLQRFSLDELPRSSSGVHPCTYDEWVSFVARAAGRVAHVPEALLRYRRHERTVSVDRSREPRWGMLMEGDEPREWRRAALRTRVAYLRQEAARDERWRDGILALADRYERALRLDERRPGPDRRPLDVVRALVAGSYRGPLRDGAGTLGLLRDVVYLRG